MRKHLILVVPLALAGCNAGVRNAEAESAAVYESLLADHCCIDAAIVQEVTDTTFLASPPRDGFEEEMLRGFSSEIHQALADLRRRSAIVRVLPDSLRVSGNDRRVPADSVGQILDRIRHVDTHRLPDRASVVRISAVGFSRDGKVAVVRLTEICGTLCGSSSLRALRKHPGGWVPAEYVWTVLY